MRKIVLYIISIVFLILPFTSILAQGELDTESKILYRNERSFGFFLNSNGIGGDYSFAKRLNARNHRLYQVEVLSLKHPKEIKVTNSYYTGNNFVFGKTNNFYEIKAQWGQQTEIYRKNDANGISIKYFFTIGPTIGLLKPVYYEVYYSTGVLYSGYTKVEKFTSAIHQTSIYGKASFFEGIKEVSLIPGASAKFGFNFEYSKQDKSINALEVGVGMDIFPKNIPIMAIESNQFFYLNLFAGYRFGKVLDIGEIAQSEKYREKMRNKKIGRKAIREEKKAEREKANL